MTDLDLDVLAGELTLVQPGKKIKKGKRARGQTFELFDAIVEPPQLELTIDGASTLTVTVADHARTLITDGGLDTVSWAAADGVNFELVGVSKSDNRLTLTFEDAIAAELRRHTKPLSAPAGKTTRREFGIRLCREAEVPYLIDPTHKQPVRNPLTRSSGGDKETSWDVLGSTVAEPINWRRFSDGTQLVLGGDDWLTSTYKKPVRLRENTNGVGSIDFDLDIAKRASTASLKLDTRLRSFLPGAPVKLEDLGPADGLWIVETFSRELTATTADLTLTRKKHVLKEPKKEKSSRGAGGDDRDKGAPGNVPGKESPTGPGTTPASNSQRETMVRWALAQSGKPYVWGASGPNSFDCSGLVQCATAAAGRTLGKPAASQWATCQGAGKAIAVSTALGIRGALLFRIGGTYNHVAISLGNGSTVEAMGSAYGCGVFGNAAGRGWTGAALWL